MIEMTSCTRVGRAGGLAAGLAIALSGVDAKAAAPGPVAAIPAADVRSGDTVVANRLATVEGVSFVRTGHPGADGDLGVAIRLGAVRLGLVEAMLELAIAHLGERTSGEEPLLRKQLVLGSIADITAGMEALRRYLDTTALMPGALAVQDIHEQITELGWQVTKFFGASGYIADHPVRCLYVSALVANAWVCGKGAAS
ncbi:MAG TPA: acyl-CoA dehydrogenase family protein [Pseudonocardiaceae bacterium]|jgi:hypothetical protein